MIKSKSIIFRVILFSSVLILGASCDSNAQSPKIDKVTLIQKFEVGKTTNFDVQRGKTDSRQPDLEKIKSSTHVAFSVLNQNGNFYECSWKYGKTNMLGINEDQLDEQTRKSLNIYQGIEVKFLIDKNGAVQDITNFEDCKKYLENAFSVIYETSTKKLSPDQIKKINETLKSSYSSPGVFISTYCPELSVFFNLFGETLKPDSVYMAKSELPNPFGGRNFPTDVTTKIETSTTDAAMITVKQTIPGNDLNEILNETFRELAKQNNRPYNESEKPKLNMIIVTTYFFDLKNNLLKEVYTEKLINLDQIKRKETLKVILKN